MLVPMIRTELYFTLSLFESGTLLYLQDGKLLIGGEVVENEELDRTADKVANNEEVIPVLKEYKTIFRSKKKGIAIHSVLLTRFNKFKQSGYFLEMLTEFGVRKSANYPMLKNAFLSLIFLKENVKIFQKF